MYVSLLTIVFAFSYRSWYILFHIQSVFTEVSLYVAHTPLLSLVKTNLDNSVYQGMNAAFSSSSVV